MENDDYHKKSKKKEDKGGKKGGKKSEKAEEAEEPKQGEAEKPRVASGHPERVELPRAGAPVSE